MPSVTADFNDEIVEAFEENNSSTLFATINPAQPPNDNFADRIDLGSGAEVMVEGFNINAEDPAQFGEPKVDITISTFNTVWWTWTAPGDGIATISTSGSDFDTFLVVYQGPVGQLSDLNIPGGAGGSDREIAFDDNTGGAGTSRLEFSAAAGGVYIIKVASLDPAVEGRIDLSISFNAPPTVSLTGPTDQAVFETVVGDNYRASFSATATAMDSDGTIASVEFLLNGMVAGMDDSAPYAATFGGLEPAVDGYAVVARAIDNKGRTVATDPITVFVDPVNDEFANAVMLPQPAADGSIVVDASNVRATADNGELAHAGSPASRSIWWTFGLADDSRVTMTTAGSEIDTALAVYTGSSVDNLTLVAENDDAAADGSSRLTFDAAGNTLYYIAVDGFEGRQGRVRLGLDVIFPPSVFIQTPTEGQSFSGASGVTVPIEARAFPISFGAPKTIAKVEIYEGQNLLRTDTSGNSTVTYDWMNVGAGDYELRAIATDSEGLTRTTPIRNITVVAPLVGVTITQHPQPRTAVVGDTVTLSVNASGSTPFSYQWFKGTVALPNRTGATLVIAGVQPSDAGDYKCQVVNGLNAPVDSDPATLTVIVPPVITLQPTGAAVVAGQTAVFMVEAAGTPSLFYQWQFNGVNIPGATMMMHVVNDAQAANSGSYTVRVTNGAGAAHTAQSSPALLIVDAPAGDTPPNLAREDFWITDQPVKAMAEFGEFVFLGGPFTYIGPNTGSAVALSPATGEPTLNFPKVDGQVNAIAADGQGGWFIGGTFDTVGGQLKSRLAHIQPGTLPGTWIVNAGWTANPDGAVNALALHDGRLFVGGTFTAIGGKPRGGLASLDATTGAADDWAAGVVGRVQALTVGDGALFVGGEFISITDGVASRGRRNLARVNLADNRIANWSADGNKAVFALAESGGTLFVGGSFTSIENVGREKLAALNAADATLLAHFTPESGVVSGANNTVRSLTVLGGVLYIGGDFDILRNHDRNFVGAVNAADGTILANWDPNANGVVRSIVAAGNSVYLGGEFTAIGMTARNRIAELAPATGGGSAQLRPWNPNASDRVLGLSFQDGQLAAVGAFRSVGGLERRFLAAVSKLTGKPVAWKPSVNGEVRALKATGRTIFAGGGFTEAGGQSRRRAAAWDIATGQLTSWNPEITESSEDSVTGVDAIEIDGNTLYLGGKFSHIGGEAHANLGAVNAQTGMPTSWTAHPNDRVRALKVMDGHLYVGGQLDRVNAQTIDFLARVALNTRLLEQNWTPDPDSSVLALEGRNGILYAGGLFRDFEDVTIRQALAAIDVAGPAPLANWNAQIFDANNPAFAVNALRIVGENLYAGGSFGEAGGGQIRENLASFALAGNGQPTSWNPNANREVFALSGSGNSIFAGGAFTSVAGQVHPHFAAFTLADAPVVTGEPADLILANGFAPTAAGGDARYQLNVAAMGGGTLTYQWSKDGVEINGAESAQYVITQMGDPVQPSDAGVYRVVVRNDEGSASSREATVTVLDQVMITQHPAVSATTLLGDDVTLSVVASGGQPLSYQWLVNGSRIAGATESTLQLNAISADQAGSYRVLVSNPVGSVTSDPAVIELSVPTDVVLSDDFGDSNVLVGNPIGSANGDNTGATVERTGGDQEPFHGGKKGGHSLWFTWQAPANGIVTFDTRGSDIDTILAVYTGSSIRSSVAGFLRMVRDADDHKDDDDDDGDDDNEDKARKRRTFFAEAVRFEAVAGTEYHIAVDGYAQATGNIVINWSLSEVAGDLPQIVEDAGDLEIGGGRRIVEPLGERVELRVLGFGVALSFKWFHNGVLIPDANGPIYVIDSLSAETVGEYQAEASNQNGSHKIRSKKFLVEIGADSNANTVNKLQDLDRSQGQQGLSGYGRPQNLIPVASGALGTQVANNAQSSTQQDELLIANQLGGSSRWLQLQITENTRMTIDTTGSEIDTLMAVYIPPQGVPLEEMQFSQLDFVDSDDNGAPDGLRSLLANLPVSAQEYLIVVDGKNGAAGEIQINYRLGDAPTITVQPASALDAQVGGQATLTVSAEGTPTPEYQWRFNGVDLPNETAATLTLPSVELSHSGSYSVMVSNHMGEKLSAISTLAVTPAGEDVAITQQPMIQPAGLLKAGDAITITVAATGDPAPSFRWRKNSSNLSDGGGLSGTGTATLSIASAQLSDSGSYDVRVTNSRGFVDSMTVTLDIGETPTIMTHPQSQSLCPGDTLTLIASATETPTPTFVWRRGTTVLSETGPTLTIASVSSQDAGSYTAQAMNNRGSDTSSAASVTVGGPPVITLQPAAFVRVDFGAAVTLGVQATGATGYQWKHKGNALPGETQAALTIGSVQPAEAGEYTVVVSGDCGSVESTVAQLAIRHLSNPNFANGKFGFQMNGDAEDVWIFEVSTNLNMWTEVGRVTLDAGGAPASATGSLTILGGRVSDTASDSSQTLRVYRIRKQ